MQEIDDLIARHGRDLAFIVNMSGGKDSVRMLGFIRENYPDQPTYVVYADTGFEHVKPVSAEQWSRERARSYGLDLHVVRNSNKTYLQMVEQRRKFPSLDGKRQCTSDLKRGPIEKFMRNTPVEHVLINCIGIRAWESDKRGKLTPWERNEVLSIPQRRYVKTGVVYQQCRDVWNWMPIFSQTLREVLQWHWDNEVPLHPVYIPEYHRDGTAGGYLRRFSCRLCIYCTDADIHAIHQHDPEAFFAVAELEQRIGFTMKNGRSLFQILETPPREKAYGYEDLDKEEEPQLCLW